MLLVLWMSQLDLIFTINSVFILLQLINIQICTSRHNKIKPTHSRHNNKIVPIVRLLLIQMPRRRDGYCSVSTVLRNLGPGKKKRKVNFKVKEISQKCICKLAPRSILSVFTDL